MLQIQKKFPDNFPHFTSVRFINSSKEGVAKSARSTGELVINKYYWDRLKPEHKFYVLAHEEGHILYDTSDELKADEHASEKYLLSGRSITESVKALSEHLDRNNPVHIARAWSQYQRALKYDYQHNNNHKAYRDHYDSTDDVRRKIQRHEFK